MEYANCNDLRKCYARKNGKCTILTVAYPKERCPFAKAKQADELSYYAQELRAKRQKAIAENKITVEEWEIISNEIEALITLHRAKRENMAQNGERAEKLTKTIRALAKLNNRILKENADD